MNFDSCIKVSLKLHIYYLPCLIFNLILTLIPKIFIKIVVIVFFQAIRKISVYHIRLLWWVCPPFSWAEDSRRPQVQLYLSLTLITLNPHLKATPDKHYSEARITSKYKRRMTNIHWEERNGCNKVMTNRLLLSNWYTLYWRFIVLVFYQSNRGPRAEV